MSVLKVSLSGVKYCVDGVSGNELFLKEADVDDGGSAQSRCRAAM